MFSLVLSKSFNSYLRFTIKINELISWVRFLYWVVLPYYVYTTTNITVCKIPSIECYCSVFGDSTIVLQWSCV